MSGCNEKSSILMRGGTKQSERFTKALDPAYFQLMDLDIADWILFAYNFAQHIHFFDKSNVTPEGNWQDFFNIFGLEDTTIPSRNSRKYAKLKKQIEAVLEDFKTKGALTPHLTLFISFLELLEFSKGRFNKLTQRHLDFYYNEILGVYKKEATPDQVHVVFELAKKAISELIPKGTSLNAKVDGNNVPRQYQLENDVVINQAKVAHLKTLIHNAEVQELKVSQYAKTFDGLEAPLPEDQPFWLPFAYPSTETGFSVLPNAEVGFAIASPMLALKEGNRIVTLKFSFEEEANLPFPSGEIIQKVCSVYASGKDKWLGDFGLDSVLLTSETVDGILGTSYDVLAFKFTVSKEEKAIVPLNSAVLLEKIETLFPVVQLKIDLGAQDGEVAIGYEVYNAFRQRKLTKIKVHVDVSEITSLYIENDNGVLKSNKPFFPFTPQPIKAANFYIQYEEAFAKQWSSIHLDFNWKDTPEDFVAWYKAYEERITTSRIIDANSQVTMMSSFGKVRAEELKGVAKKIFDKDAHSEEEFITVFGEGNVSTNPKAIVRSNNYFTIEIAVLDAKNWLTFEKEKSLFVLNTEDEAIDYKYALTAQRNSISGISNPTGPLRFRLNNSFLHDVFPRLYALALSSTSGTVEIPNPPYTPIAEDITLRYVAEEERIVSNQILGQDTSAINIENTKEVYDKEHIQLFHLTGFGIREEHNYLKIKARQSGIKTATETAAVNSFLVPKYCVGSELYIGLENTYPKDLVSLLIQVLEGTENTELDGFQEGEEIQWDVLCDNRWKSIQKQIVSNNTDNFLKSGIVKFPIPVEATNENTAFPSGYIWVRASMGKKYNVVCKAIDIHAQAAIATFENNGNELSHLERGLEANTIKKLITRVPKIKGVAQPYNSFGGYETESNDRFYRRISERIRHKKRAVTLWDYEHLILQEFPQVFKVKCLNHTAITKVNTVVEPKYTSAGNVTLVVIPDTVNKNVFDRFEPRLSKATLNEIKQFTNMLNSHHVNAEIINPTYEQVTVQLEVSFYDGLDANFYRNQLNDDIICLLSPWAYDNTQEVIFGIELHKSVLVDYVEKLDYVDYIQHVYLKKGTIDQGNLARPETPISILVSSKKHIINPLLTTCTQTKTTPNLVCQ